MVEFIIGLSTEIITILVGVSLILAFNKTKAYVDSARKKDELGIIDIVTDRVVEYAEAELKGAEGIRKRDLAVHKATEILKSKGIKATESEILSGIENGVRKLKSTGLIESTPIQFFDGLVGSENAKNK